MADTIFVVTFENDLNYWEPTIYPNKEWDLTNILLFSTKEKAMEYIYQSTGRYPTEGGKVDIGSIRDPKRVVQTYRMLERKIN